MFNQLENIRKLEEHKQSLRDEAKRQAELTPEQKALEREIREEQQVEYAEELFKQAQEKGRNLSLSEKDKIAREIITRTELVMSKGAYESMQKAIKEKQPGWEELAKRIEGRQIITPKELTSKELTPKIERIKEIFEERRPTRLGMITGVIKAVTEFPPRREDIPTFERLEYKDIERREPGWTPLGEKYIKSYVKKVAPYIPAALGFAAALYIVPTALAVKEDKEAIPYVEKYAPERKDIQILPSLKYTPPKRPEPSKEWLAPRKEDIITFQLVE